MSSFLNEIARGKVYFSSLVFLCACRRYFLWLLAPLGGKVINVVEMSERLNE